jgi:hypothetical protein
MMPLIGFDRLIFLEAMNTAYGVIECIEQKCIGFTREISTHL